jgi:hypothetical protein
MSADATARREELLSDSEATLRQVQSVLADFAPALPSDELTDEQRPEGLSGLTELVEILVTTYGGIMSVIGSLRKSRGMLEQAAMERLKSTHRKLAEVSSATEMAATGMLDGLDRALVLVDHLEAADESAEPGAVLLDIEDRLVELARIFDLMGVGQREV